MADIGQWRPVKGTHAIQMASLTITFAEPVNDRPWRRIEQLATQVTNQHGLLTKQAVQLIEMRIQANAVPAVQPPNEAGVEFLRRISPDFFAEKLQILRNSIVYENWDYTRWTPMKKKATMLMKGIFDLYSQGVEMIGITASYVDGFQATMTGVDVDCAQIINPRSKTVAARAFTRMKPWHTHCGWFEYLEPWCRRLHQVNIDVADAQLPDGETRVAQIMTVANDQFRQKGLAPVPADKGTWEDVLQRFQSCHEALKGNLASVLTKEASAAISLGPQ